MEVTIHLVFPVHIMHEGRVKWDSDLCLMKEIM